MQDNLIRVEFDGGINFTIPKNFSGLYQSVSMAIEESADDGDDYKVLTLDEYIPHDIARSSGTQVARFRQHSRIFCVCSDQWIFFALTLKRIHSGASIFGN
jgi:hypothetical protein